MADGKKQLDIVVEGKDNASGVIARMAANVKKSLDGIKGSVGEDSALGGLGKVLAGAGAVAGITLIGRELNMAVDKVGEIAKRFREGNVGAADLTEEVGRSLPVYGQIVDAGRKIRGLIDGTAGEVERITGFNQQIDASLKRQAVAIKEQAAAYFKLGEAVQSSRDQRALIGLPDPGRSLLGIDQGLAQQRRAADEQIRLLKEQSKEKAASLNSLRQNIADATAGINAIGGGNQVTAENAGKLRSLRSQRDQLQASLNAETRLLKEGSREADLIRQDVVEKERNAEKAKAVIQRDYAHAREQNVLASALRVRDIEAQAKEASLRALGRGGLADTFRDIETANKAGGESFRKLGEEVRGRFLPAIDAARDAVKDLARFQRPNLDAANAVIRGNLDSITDAGNFVKEAVARNRLLQQQIKATLAGEIGQSLKRGFESALGSVPKFSDVSDAIKRAIFGGGDVVHRPDETPRTPYVYGAASQVSRFGGPVGNGFLTPPNIAATPRKQPVEDAANNKIQNEILKGTGQMVGLLTRMLSKLDAPTKDILERDIIRAPKGVSN